MNEELLALESNSTWDLAPTPQDASIIGSKWVYHIQVHSDGSLDRYKARLVAQGTSRNMELAMRRLLHQWLK